jgi:hypothetical protein
LGAETARATTQDVLPGAVRVVLVQLSPLKGDCENVPDPPTAEMEVPRGVEATTLVSCTGIVAVDGFEAIWNVAVATIPSAMLALFRPKIRQMLPAQETDFPAPVAEGPGVTVTPVMSEEKPKLHWRPAV